MDDKEKFERNYGTNLKRWQQKITEIKSLSARVPAQYKIEFERQVDLLFAKHDLAKAKLSQLKKAEGVAWDELKSSLDGIANEIENAIDSAVAKID